MQTAQPSRPVIATTAAADLGAAGSLQQPIGGEPARGVADDAGPQRQRGQQAAFEQREMPHVDEIGRQPGQENPQAIDVSEIGAA